MLGNERFVSKAPEAKVQEEKDKLAQISADVRTGQRTDRKNFIKIRSG